MKPSRLVTSGGVRHHTARGKKKITKAALVGGAAAAAIAATVGVACPGPGVSRLRLLPRRRWRIRLVRLLRRPNIFRRQLRPHGRRDGRLDVQERGLWSPNACAA